MTDVHLYVYDLSQGMARQMSMQFLGTQIDAVYHTAIVINGIEYFYGQGIQMTNAGQTHHGRPMEVISLGQTSLPEDLILDYLNSLKEIYTPESYDLFAHNCNNFSNDFSMFLVGKGIPEKISSLPKTVLDTPFGQMLRPQLDQSMRSVTQAPLPPPTRPIANDAAPNNSSHGRVRNMTSLSAVESLIKSAPSSVIFFTSATCAPCKIAYPAFDELAEEAGSKCALIKVDIDKQDAQGLASKYQIRATPTFMTFLRGVKQEEWAGADPSRLRGSVRMLIQAAFPPHPHERLRLAQFNRASRSMVLYSKMPPLEKLTAKLGDKAGQAAPATNFIKARSVDGARETPLPDMQAVVSFFRKCLKELPAESLFAAYDLMRLMLVDVRMSAYMVEQRDPGLVLELLNHVNKAETCPYNLRLVSIHMACNLFSSPVARHAVPGNLSLCSAITTLIANSLLDEEHANLRVAAASLAYNLTATDYEANVLEKGNRLPDELQVELAAALIEALRTEAQSAEAIRGEALSLGRLIYKADLAAELCETCRALEAGSVLSASKTALASKDDQPLLREIADELLSKGLVANV